MRSNLISISISIHALREEGDSLSEAITKLKADFYPRPPRGGRLADLGHPVFPREFLSTPSARRATSREVEHTLRRVISIHALREEGDSPQMAGRECTARFLSTPSARRATADHSAYLAGAIFLSTPSARRATFSSPSGSHVPPDFYPRPPRGGRHGEAVLGDQRVVISIHALREEGDASPSESSSPRIRFLSTPSARRATTGIVQPMPEGANFYPRPPRGGRPQSLWPH